MRTRMPWGLSLRMTVRDWRAGELRFLLLSLIVAVAALSAVGFFVDRMRAGLQRDANQLLGGDLVIRSDQPIPAAWKDEARRRGLATAETAVFPSMASASATPSGPAAGVSPATSAASASPSAPSAAATAPAAIATPSPPAAQLASVKAVSAGYPLRGSLKLVGFDGKEQPVSGIPAAGTVWVDQSLLLGLGLSSSGAIKLGDRIFRVGGVIAAEPDRGATFVNFAPRLMLGMQDLPGTGLVQTGSRITWRLLLAGPAAAVKGYQQWMEQAIAQQSLRGVHLESLESGRPEMRATLDRATQFLSLVSLLSALLAAVAIAMAARRFMLRHLDACAMLRCLGLTQSQTTFLFALEFLLVALGGSLLGVAIGFAAHHVLLAWLGQLVTTRLPPPGVLPALQGMATGLLLVIGFALPPILQLRNVPHNRVIRREQTPPRPATLFTYLLGLASFLSLLLWQAGDLTLGALTAGGYLAGLALFALTGWLFLRGVSGLRHRVRNPAWRFALTALQRRPGASVTQIVALSLGLMALLLLTVIRGDLVSAWQRATPPDAPNRFVINIQPDQKDAAAAALRRGGVRDATLYPMIRGRLVAVNGKPVTENSYEEGRARRLVDREFNLSTMREPPPDNRIVAGHWYDDRKPEASIEQGLAKTLGLKLGDRLTFDVAGQTVEAPITSVRKLDWASMRVNFFVILNPSLMADLPQSFITAFHLPASREGLMATLVRTFPNFTVVDIGTVIRQIQAVIDNVVIAVEFLFLFTLLSGVLVLYAALLSSQEARTREAALLRALGATRAQLSSAQWIEFALVGGIAGLLAATGAAAIGWGLSEQVFHFDWTFRPLVWLVGMLAGMVCALGGGWLGLRRILSRAPLQSLREA